MSDNSQPFHFRLKNLRVQKGKHSLQKFAEEIGFTYDKYNNLEKGKTFAEDIADMTRLFYGLNLTPGELYYLFTGNKKAMIEEQMPKPSPAFEDLSIVKKIIQQQQLDIDELKKKYKKRIK